MSLFSHTSTMYCLGKKTLLNAMDLLGSHLDYLKKKKKVGLQLLFRHFLFRPASTPQWISNLLASLTFFIPNNASSGQRVSILWYY